MRSRPEFRTARGSGRYKGARRAFLRQNPLCVKCAEHGKTVAAVQLDHIVRVEFRPDLFWNENNWQALCRRCHLLKTKEEQAKTLEGERALHDWVTAFD